MFNKGIFLFILFFSMSVHASLNEELKSLYGSAFKNNWRKVSAKTAAIIESYEKSGDVIKTKKQLVELEKFVLVNKLNPVKTQLFLSELRELEKHLVKPREQKNKMPTQQVSYVAPVQSAQEVNGKNLFFKLLAVLSLLSAAVAGGLLVFIRKYKINPQTEYAFENGLEDIEKALWNYVKPAFNTLNDKMKEPKVFLNDKLFSLEFDLQNAIPNEHLSELKNVMASLEAELLILTEWETESSPIQKVVLNFPVSRSR